MVFPINDQVQTIPDEMLRKAQHGDLQTREYIIKTYQPFVIRAASRYCGRFLHVGVDEETSIALLALNEAIDHYVPDQGRVFAAFVRVVVKRRLVDYFRRNQSRMREIPFSEFEDSENEEGSALYALELSEAEKAFHNLQDARSRQDEIKYFVSVLARYDITLSELVKHSPKHESARKRCVLAARTIYQNQELLQHFTRRKELPLKELESIMPFSRKTLERQRKYIVGLLLVYIEDLPHIREYLKGEDRV